MLRQGFRFSYVLSTGILFHFLIFANKEQGTITTVQTTAKVHDCHALMLHVARSMTTLMTTGRRDEYCIMTSQTLCILMDVTETL